MPAEGLKEYLVNIGWSSDQFGLKDVEKGIESVSSGLKGLTKISGFASAGVNFAKSMVQAAASVWSLVSGVAEADREAQHVDDYASSTSVSRCNGNNWLYC